MLQQPLSFPYNSSLFRILTSCFENDLYELICKTAERWWCQKPAWLRILFLRSLNSYSRVRYIQGVKRFHEPVFYLSALTSSWWTEKSYRKKDSCSSFRLFCKTQGLLKIECSNMIICANLRRNISACIL